MDAVHKAVSNGDRRDAGAQIQITFSLLIVLQTFFSPAQGWLIERFGPKLLIGTGAVLSGLGWVLSSYATSLFTLYLTYGLFCGIGTGIVYVGIVGLMVRWFPDRRGSRGGHGGRGLRIWRLPDHFSYRYDDEGFRNATTRSSCSAASWV